MSAPGSLSERLRHEAIWVANVGMTLAVPECRVGLAFRLSDIADELDELEEAQRQRSLRERRNWRFWRRLGAAFRRAMAA
jgi:hypothetical protein